MPKFTGKSLDVDGILNSETVTYNLLWEAGPAGQGKRRMYATSVGFILTYNARWVSGSTWTRDITDYASHWQWDMQPSPSLTLVYYKQASYASGDITWNEGSRLATRPLQGDVYNSGGSPGVSFISFNSISSGNLIPSSVFGPYVKNGDVIEASCGFNLSPGGNTFDLWLDAYYNSTYHAIPGTRREFTGSTTVPVQLAGRVTLTGITGTVADAKIYLRYDCTVAPGTTNLLGEWMLQGQVLRTV